MGRINISRRRQHRRCGRKKLQPAHNHTQPGHFSIEVQLAGPVPAPTVILSHGSGGLWKHQRNWAASLIEAGYNVAMIDNFTEKGVEPHVSKVDIRTVPEERQRYAGYGQLGHGATMAQGQIRRYRLQPGWIGRQSSCLTRCKNLKLAGDMIVHLRRAGVLSPRLRHPFGGTDLP